MRSSRRKMAQLEATKKQRTEILIDDARKRLDRNPTDLQLRYELGEQLTNAGEYRDALPELQRARQNPNVRLKAMNLLGRCYRELGMLDLAAKQLEDAAREMTVMDEVKKEIVYNLGLVYEQMGDAEKYIDAMKKIYEADYGYRDVAKRVESWYDRANGGRVRGYRHGNLLRSGKSWPGFGARKHFQTRFFSGLSFRDVRRSTSRPR